MRNELIHRIIKQGLLALGVFIFSTNVSFADVLSCTPSSSPKNVGGKTIQATSPDCPNGQTKRNDISVGCIANIASNNDCIDIMPAQDKSKVVRIPEDVCFRNEGWGNKRNHNGIDYAMGAGSGVVAAADGEVKFAGNVCGSTSKSGNGIYVMIEHRMASQSSDDGAIVQSGHTTCFRTYYLHLSEVLVRTGQTVKKGTPVGKVGGSGCSGGRVNYSAYPVHLHFEMRTCGDAIIDPFCPALGDLCPKKEGSTPFNPNECRNCHPNCNVGSYTSSPGGSGGDPAGSTIPEAGVGNPKKCTVADYKSSFESCIFCDVFKVLFDTASTVAAKSFSVLTMPVFYVVLIATALWLAFTILKYISSFEVKEPRAMVKEILNKIFLVFFVLVILYFGPGEFVKYTLEPIFNTGMDMAMLASASGTSASCDYTVITAAEGGGLPESMGINLLCVIKTVQDSLLDVMSMGSTLICIGLFEQSFMQIPIFPHFGYLLTGLGFWVAALLMMIIYPWLLVDSVLKISIAIILLPAAIGAYAFEVTRKYSGKVWETFLNSMFTFMFLSIIIFILISTIDDTLDKADFREYLVDNMDQKSMLSELGWWGSTFLTVMFVILLGWAVLGEGSSFAGDFSGGMNIGPIGSSVGTLAMSGAKGVAEPVAKKTAEVGAKAGKAISSKATEKISNAKINRQARIIKNSKYTTTDKDGNMTQSYKNWRGKDVTRTLSVDANGNKSIATSQTDKNGNVTTKTADKFMTVESVKDKDGNIVREDYNVTDAAAKNLFKKDGTLNQNAYNNLMNNSLHNKETLQKAMMNQMMKQRFGEEGGLKKNFKEQQFSTSTDKDGNTVVSLVRKNNDGTTQNVNMTMDGKRVMLEVEEISKNGRSETKASDGIMTKTSVKHYNKDGSVNKNYGIQERYDVTDYYKKFSGKPISTSGKFANGIPQDEIMFKQDDVDKFAYQVARYGYAKSGDKLYSRKLNESEQQRLPDGENEE